MGHYASEMGYERPGRKSEPRTPEPTPDLEALTGDSYEQLRQNRNYWADECRKAWEARDAAQAMARIDEAAAIELAAERDRLRAEVERLRDVIGETMGFWESVGNVAARPVVVEVALREQERLRAALRSTEEDAEGS